MLNSVVKISMMSAKYFEYYTIILRGAVFSWTHCCPAIRETATGWRKCARPLPLPCCCRTRRAHITSATRYRYRCTTAATATDSSLAWTCRALGHAVSGCSVARRSASSRSRTTHHPQSFIRTQVVVLCPSVLSSGRYFSLSCTYFT